MGNMASFQHEFACNLIQTFFANIFKSASAIIFSYLQASVIILSHFYILTYLLRKQVKPTIKKGLRRQS